MTDNMNRTRAGLVNLTSNVQRSLVIFESTSHSGLEGGAIKDAFKEVNGEALGKNFFAELSRFRFFYFFCDS